MAEAIGLENGALIYSNLRFLRFSQKTILEIITTPLTRTKSP
jgi:hypothetical protein